MEQDYIERVAKTAWQQILGGVGASVAMSWGISRWIATEKECRDGVCKACLVLQVSGLIHTGFVVVAYDRASDTYEVLLENLKGEPVGEWHTDVYCDELGKLIDSLVEKPTDMSQEDYEELSSIDSFIKWLAE